MIHSPEPWRVDLGIDAHYLAGSDGYLISDLHQIKRDNVLRIIACVNACAGIETEWLVKYGVVRRAAKPLSEIDWEDLA